MPSGLVLLTPTSVTKTGTGSTATIGTNGQVTFSTCATLMVNGVFSSTYDNYRVVFRGTAAASDGISIKFAESGTATGGLGYYDQQYQASGTSIAGQRNGSTSSAVVSLIGSYGPSGVVLDIYRPYIAEDTAFRGVAVASGDANNSVLIREHAGMYTVGVSLDGFQLIAALGNGMTGTLTVYGWNV